MSIVRHDVFIEDLSSVKRTPQGFAQFTARATRTGVFTYFNKDGSHRRELRHPTDVFKEDSMATLARVAITNEHPKELVTSKNAKHITVGMTGDSVDIDGQYLKVEELIMDEVTIKQAMSGKKAQVSCGYTCNHIDESGEFEGERYDVRQTDIEYNHLAVVPIGRAGPGARLRLDAIDGMMMTDESLSSDSDVKEEKTKEDDDMNGKETKEKKEVTAGS